MMDCLVLQLLLRVRSSQQFNSPLMFVGHVIKRFVDQPEETDFQKTVCRLNFHGFIECWHNVIVQSSISSIIVENHKRKRSHHIMSLLSSYFPKLAQDPRPIWQLLGLVGVTGRNRRENDDAGAATRAIIVLGSWGKYEVITKSNLLSSRARMMNDDKSAQWHHLFYTLSLRKTLSNSSSTYSSEECCVVFITAI